MSRKKKDFKKALIDVAEDYRGFLTTLIVMLEDTYLNTKDKRLDFAKGLRAGRFQAIIHFVAEEKRLQAEEND